MKKDRDCGTPYPTYPMPLYGGMPMNPGMMPMTGTNPTMNPTGMMNQGMGYGMNPYSQIPAGTMSSNSNIEEQLNHLNREVSNLEKRISSLESLVGNPNNTKYNTTNYQMM